MTWTNAFDVGACTVKVSRGATVDFNAVMAKGATEDVTDGLYTGLTVSVSSTGVVALNNPSEAGVEDVFELTVTPASWSGIDGARATLPSCGSGTGEASGNGDIYDTFTNGDAAVDLSAASPLDRITAHPTDQGASSVTPIVQFTPELDIGTTPTPPDVTACTELGRVTRCYVSGYQRARVHESRLVRGEFRCLVANFNGAVDTARTIVSVTWKCQQPYAVAMSNARIADGEREVAVDIAAQLPGESLIKCLATFDNGETYTQMFRLWVDGSPWFADDTAPSAGPTSLTSP